MTSFAADSFSPTNKIPQLENFILVEKIGSGTYATVYKGYKKSDDTRTPYAIKCIAKSSLNKLSVENLLVEIEILKQIEHENVVQLIEFQWDDSYIFLIMEYCAGGDLLSLIQAKRFIPESIARRFLQQIASALQLLHSNNISHLDLKPQNILLSSVKNPVLKLADFGFAQYIEQNRDFHIRGTPLYMAPEILLRHHYDAKVDLWSVGVILYESLFGQAPFASKSFDQLEIKIKSDQPIQLPSSPAVSNECRNLLLQLLKRNPEERMSFQEFFNDPFVDLEHKPSKDCIDKARSIVTKAVEEDKKGNLSDAVKLYMQAVEYFVSAVYYERDRRKKDLLREKVNEYCYRAEQLKHLLKPSEKILEYSSLKNLSQLMSDNSTAIEGLKHLASARSLDIEEKYSGALSAYEQGLTLLLPLSSEETNLLRKNLLRELIKTSLKRAEDIKDYIKVNQLNKVTAKEMDDVDKKSNSDCVVQ